MEDNSNNEIESTEEENFEVELNPTSEEIEDTLENTENQMNLSEEETLEEESAELAIDDEHEAEEIAFELQADEESHDLSVANQEIEGATSGEDDDEIMEFSEEALDEDGLSIHEDSELEEEENDLDEMLGFEEGEETLEAIEGDEHEAGVVTFPIKELMSLETIVESIIFAAPAPIGVGEMLTLIQDESLTTKEVLGAIESLMRFHSERGGGFKLEHVKGGYQFQTIPAAGPIMERMFSSRARPISRAAQETLAIIAYRQPVTRADIEFIRGVDAGSIVKNLLERNLIKCVGRKEDAGRPMLFGTTDEFLQVYNMESLKDLPSLESFQPSMESMEDAAKALEDSREVEVEQFMDDPELKNNDEMQKEVDELLKVDSDETNLSDQIQLSGYDTEAEATAEIDAAVDLEAELNQVETETEVESPLEDKGEEIPTIEGARLAEEDFSDDELLESEIISDLEAESELS